MSWAIVRTNAAAKVHETVVIVGKNIFKLKVTVYVDGKTEEKKVVPKRIVISGGSIRMIYWSDGSQTVP